MKHGLHNLPPISTPILLTAASEWETDWFWSTKMAVYFITNAWKIRGCASKYLYVFSHRLKSDFNLARWWRDRFHNDWWFIGTHRFLRRYVRWCCGSYSGYDPREGWFSFRCYVCYYWSFVMWTGCLVDHFGGGRNTYQFNTVLGIYFSCAAPPFDFHTAGWYNFLMRSIFTWQLREFPWKPVKRWDYPNGSFGFWFRFRELPYCHRQK